MPKTNKVITIQQNQLLEIPNDNIEIEAIEDTNTENQNLLQDIIEIEDSQDVNHDLSKPIVKVKKPRVKKDKIIPVQIVESSDESEISRPIEILDVLNVEPELTPKEVKLLQQVKCDKCNRKMAEATLKYKHPKSCPGNQPKLPKQPTTKDIKVEPVEEIEDIEDEIITPPPMLPLKRATSQCPLTMRQNKIHQKKEQYKALFDNAI